MPPQTAQAPRRNPGLPAVSSPSKEGRIETPPSSETPERESPAASAAPSVRIVPPLPSRNVIKTGIGVVVCEPAAPKGDAALSAFGTGCGRWLHLNVAGQPDFGQTPLWSSQERAEQELGRNDFQLTPSEAARLNVILGINRVATGEIKGDPANCTLTYRIWQIPGNKAVGQPLTISGSEEQVVAGLPRLAQQMIAQMGVPGAQVADVGLSASELSSLGQVPWPPKTDAPAAAQQQLNRSAQRSPLAGVLALRSSGSRDATAFAAAITTLLQQAPDNPLIYGEVGWQIPAALKSHEAQITEREQRYPDSYLFAMTEVRLRRASGEPKPERQAAERVVRNAPRSPEAWLTLGWTISSEAEAIRKAVYYSMMNEEQKAAVGKLYDQWVRTVVQSVKLDPGFAKGWSRVAEAATFAGPFTLADDAFWKAVSLDKDNPEMYVWGLQMYQSKWSNFPQKLIKVAQEYARVCRYDDRAYAGVQALYDSKMDADAKQLTAQIIAKNQEILVRGPKDARARASLAWGLKEQKQYPAAIREYETLVQQNPQDAKAHNTLGMLYDQNHQQTQAVAEFREAVRLDPHLVQAHYELGYALKRQGQLDEAEKELQAALRIDPRYENARYGLGEIYLMRHQPDKALAMYEDVVRQHPSFVEAQMRLCYLYAEQKRYEDAVKAGAIAVRLQPDNAEARYMLSYSYAMKGDYAACAEQCRMVIRIAPTYALAHEALGESLVHLGQKEEGRAELQTAIRQDPHGPAGAEARKVLAQNP
jgi:tetratricopeptide (TPR) repeat protein